MVRDLEAAVWTVATPTRLTPGETNASLRMHETPSEETLPTPERKKAVGTDTERKAVGGHPIAAMAPAKKNLPTEEEDRKTGGTASIRTVGRKTTIPTIVTSNERITIPTEEDEEGIIGSGTIIRRPERGIGIQTVTGIIIILPLPTMSMNTRGIT